MLYKLAKGGLNMIQFNNDVAYKAIEYSVTPLIVNI